jgi:putative ABC transport system ATP-binding protein
VNAGRVNTARPAAASISLDAVTKHYTTPAGVVRAVDGITIDVEPGTSLAVTGPSGCGKSTLLGLVGGLEAPTSGRVTIDGRAVESVRHELGFVFQTDNLLPFLTALENVALRLALAGAADGYERGVELLGALGLADEADKLPDQLSGGQRQRVAVARALIHRPRLILADEPTGELDARGSAAVLDLLVAAQRDAGTTLLIVTHDPAIARRLDRTLGLRDGRAV